MSPENREYKKKNWYEKFYAWSGLGMVPFCLLLAHL